MSRFARQGVRQSPIQALQVINMDVCDKKRELKLPPPWRKLGFGIAQIVRVDFMLIPRLAAALLAIAAVTTPGLAEEMTDTQLLQLFQSQRDAFQAAKLSGVGQTRGLTLVTVDTVQAIALAPELTAPTLDQTATTLPSNDGNVTVLAEPGQPVVPLVDQTATIETSSSLVQPVVFGALSPELQINLNIRFPFDSAVLTPDQKPTLDQMCKVMRGSDINLFRIVGHTDTSGSTEYNQKLSQLRAEEVKRFQIGRAHV